MGSGIIVGAMAIDGNAYDRHTLEPQLEQVNELTEVKINTLSAAAAYNMKKWMRFKRQEILSLIFRWFFLTFDLVPANIKPWRIIEKHVLIKIN